MRNLTADEISKLADEYKVVQKWQHVSDVIRKYYGEKATSVSYFGEAYIEDGDWCFDTTENSDYIHVYDYQGNELPPFYDLFDIDEEEDKHYVIGAILVKLQFPMSVMLMLPYDFNQITIKGDYDFSTPPQISYPDVYTQ